MKKGTGMRRFMIMAMVRKNGKCVKVEMARKEKDHKTEGGAACE